MSAHPWLIRKATDADADGLQTCMTSAYQAYRERMGGERLPPMNVDYRSEIRDYPAWVVTLEDEVVGGLIMAFDNNRASIANIAVNPEFQGRGIGGELMRFAESEARVRRFSELHLATHELLHENIALYRHLGWVETGKAANKVFMLKKL